MMDTLHDAFHGLASIATALVLGAMVALLLTGQVRLDLPFPSFLAPQQGSERQAPSAPGCAHVRATRCS